MEFVEQEVLLNKKYITNNDIKKINELLLKNFDLNLFSQLFVQGLLPIWDKKIQQQIRPNIIGQYRIIGLKKIQKDGSIINFMPAKYIEAKMKENLKNYNNVLNNSLATEIEKINAALLFHLNFEFIHLFPEGNGRTGRLILDSMFFKQNIYLMNIKDKQNHQVYLKNLKEILEPKEKGDDWVLLTSIPAKMERFFYIEMLEEVSNLTNNNIVDSQSKKWFSSWPNLLIQIEEYLKNEKNSDFI